MANRIPRFVLWVLILILFQPFLPIDAVSADRAPRRLLGRQLESIDLTRTLASAEDFRPFPPAEDRAAWSGIPEARRHAFIAEAERQLAAPWAFLPASRFLEYVEDGDRRGYEDLLFSRRRKLAYLVLGELMEDRGRFTEAIVDGIWLVCEESFWGVPAHLDAQKLGHGLPDVTEPTVDLFAAETGALLAWTDYLLGSRIDGVHPLVRERVRHEVDRRILTPALERTSWWMGSGGGEVNNWTTWIGSNWLACVLLLERDAGRRSQAVGRIVRSLDIFIDSYPDDGGCPEGPGYWGRAGASLFESLEMLHAATGGRIDIFGEPVVRAIGAYIARAYIHGDYFVNGGDSSPKVKPYPEVIFRFGRATGDPALEGFGSFLAARRGPVGPADVPAFGSLGRVLPAILGDRDIAGSPSVEPLDGEIWLPDLQMMAAREKPGSRDGLYLAVTGGNNGPSHSHNDVGNMIVYADGAPLLIDPGVGEYTAKTFGPNRYDIWTMRSRWHNLPLINGLGQRNGSAYRARDVVFSSGPSSVRISLDIAPAYAPDAMVETWRREVTLDRKKGEIVLSETYVLGEVREPVRLHFLTPLRPDLPAPGRVALAGYMLRYDPDRFTAKVEAREISDRRLHRAWGERIYRIVLTTKGRSAKGSHTIAVHRAGATEEEARP